jgi:predicted dehydrogenase
VHASLEDLFASGLRPDLAVIASPPHRHVPQSCLALENGCHVLCDKPLGAVVQDADRLIRARETSKRQVLIGYQWSFSAAVQALKAEIRSGRWGRPLRFKSLCLWPRDRAYYLRNDWAGRMRDRRGVWILDSPANNAMAHFLHNLLYLLGDSPDRSAEPTEITAEAYRVFPIENYDTVSCRILTQAGAELLFYASHAVPAAVGPRLHLSFEGGEVSCRDGSGEIICRSGPRGDRSLGAPGADHPFTKLFYALELAAAGEGPVLCGPEAARAQTLCINGIQESVAEIVDLSRSPALREGDGRLWIAGMAEDLVEAYTRGRLPSEMGRTWAVPGRPVALEGYRFFPGGVVPGVDRP